MYTQLASITISGDTTAELSFDNIPQEYKHLEVYFLSKISNTGIANLPALKLNGGIVSQNIGISQFQNSSVSTYSAYDNTDYNQRLSRSGSTNQWTMTRVTLPNYSVSNEVKFSSGLVIAPANGTMNVFDKVTRSTFGAITSLQLYGLGYTLANGTRAELYGVL